jgi:hypothetical protein
MKDEVQDDIMRHPAWWAVWFPGSLMARYRLYLMDGLGKIGAVEFLEAVDDREAVHLACEMRLSVSAEVWDRDRFVAGIPAASLEELRRA